jgi:hypothetical protein
MAIPMAANALVLNPGAIHLEAFIVDWMGAALFGSNASSRGFGPHDIGSMAPCQFQGVCF